MAELIGNRAPVTYKRYPMVNDLDMFQGLIQGLTRVCVEGKKKKAKERESSIWIWAVQPLSDGYVGGIASKMVLQMMSRPGRTEYFTSALFLSIGLTLDSLKCE